MSELPRIRPISEPRGPLGLAFEHYHTYSRLQFNASGASRELIAAQKRPKRHNKPIERLALWHTVLLDAECERVLTSGSRSLLMPRSTDVDFRYELQAGIRTVHAVVPFTAPERLALHRDRGHILDDVENFRSPLIDRWHQWLWVNERGEQQTSVENLGASAVLLEACLRLNRVLLPTLER